MPASCRDEKSDGGSASGQTSAPMASTTTAGSTSPVAVHSPSRSLPTSDSLGIKRTNQRGSGHLDATSVGRRRAFGAADASSPFSGSRSSTIFVCVLRRSLVVQAPPAVPAAGRSVKAVLDQATVRSGAVEPTGRVFGVVAVVVCLGLVAGCGNGTVSRSGSVSSRSTTVATPRLCASSAQLDLVFNVRGPDEETGDIVGVVGPGRVRKLTTDGASYDPHFTPDGAHVVFTSGSSLRQVSASTGPQELSLYVIAVDGSGRSRLTKGKSDTNPAVSPAGAAVAFARGVDDHLAYGHQGTRLHVVNIGDHTEHALLKDPPQGDEVRDWSPTWSPAGDRIAFVRTTPPKARGVGGTTGPQATAPPSGPNGSGPFGKGGGRPPQDSALPNDSVWVVDSDGSNARKLLGDLRNVRELSWSPDGRRLAYGTEQGYVDAPTYVVNVDDGKPRRVADTAQRPAWSADGRALLYYQVRRNSGASIKSTRIVELDLSTKRERDLNIGNASPGFIYDYYGIGALPCRRH